MGFFLAVWVVSAVAGAVIGVSKGRGEIGFTLGLILPVVGVGVIAAMHPTPEFEALRSRELVEAARVPPTTGNGMPSCPYCAELVKPAAKSCSRCGRVLRTEPAGGVSRTA